MKTTWTAETEGVSRATDHKGYSLYVSAPPTRRHDWYVRATTPGGGAFLTGSARGPRKARELAVQLAYRLSRRTR